MTRLFGFGLKEKWSSDNGVGEYSGSNCAEEIKGLSNLYCPQEEISVHVRDVVDVLCEMGKITSNQLSEVRQTQEKQPDCDVAQIIRELKLADEPDISMARASLYGFEFRRI